MPDLRERLIVRFTSLFWDSHDASGEFPSDFIKRSADECIRQMEWAYQEAFLWHNEPGREWDRTLSGLPLPRVTLAPDDWTPNKESDK